MAVWGYTERLRRCKLLAFLQFLGNFLGCHGFSPFLGLPPWAVTHLYANPGPNVQFDRKPHHPVWNVEDVMAGLRSMRLAQPELMGNKSTNR